MSIGRINVLSEARYSKAPSALAIVLCVAAAAVCMLVRLDWSLAAYVGAIVAGSLLIFLQRRLVMKATRRASSTRLGRMSLLERLAVWAVVVACLANGVVIALYVSRMPWGA